MTTKATRITPTEFRADAERALLQVFKTPDLEQGPFRDQIEERLIIRDDGYLLQRGAFEALSKAAESIGDDHLLYTILRGEPGPERLTWRLPLYEYDDYYDAETSIDKREVGILLDRALYSPRGKWGILFPELFALVGGSSEFVTHFKDEYPDWPRDLDDFLRGRREVRDSGRADTSWVQPLLRHIYGSGAPVF